MALAVSALVGITAGVIVGITTGDPGSSRADDGDPTRPTTSATPSTNDPLGIGATLANLDCTGKTILVVGWGSADHRGALTNAVSANPGTEVKYLKVADSCDTLYGAEKQEAPEYAAYLGPFDSIAEPCELRMNIDHKNDVVTTLKQGVKIHVQCLCVLDPEEFPTLAVGMDADTREGIYIRALQRLLIDIGQNPDHHVNGRYDLQTSRMIIPLQRLNALDSDFEGTVEKQTWGVLRDRACVNYDF
jgi:hypothetical protein